MQNISNNSNDFNFNLSDNYKTINAQYIYSRTKKSIRLIKNKNLNTFFSNHFNKNKKRKENKFKSHKISSIDINSKNSNKNSIKNSFDYKSKENLKHYIN